MSLVLACSLLLGACEKDPHDPNTWIAKLDEPAEIDEAVRNLERLKDPKSIKPLGEMWKKRNRPHKVLATIVTIAGGGKEGKPSYDDAVPYLVEAVDNFDPNDEQSISSATMACEALGRAGHPDAVQPLINAVQKAMPKLSQGNRVRIAAVRALGKFKDPRAVDVLVKVLRADPEQQRLHLHAAAALALAESGTEKALPALTQALVEIGAIYKQVRQGITRVGKPAIPAMTALFQDKDPDVQKIAKEKDFAKKAPGVVMFKSALLLGDLRATEAVPMLVEALKTEPKVSYFDEKTGAPGPSTHMAILQALQTIGDPSAAPALAAYMTNPKTDDFIRPRAIDVYSWIAPDTSQLPKLLSWIKDEKQEDQLRSVAAIAYGRIGRTAADAKPLDDLIKSYEGKMAAAEAKAKSAKDQAGKDTATAEKEQAQQWKDLLTEARHRISLVEKCKEDAACYGAAVVDKDVAPGKPGMPKAERALIELYRMGSKGAPAVDDLLKAADTTERTVREAIGLALPRIAPKPCDKCAERLDKVMASQASQQTLDDLNVDTRVVYHYFLWAGK